jgi:hypothetical protein
LSQFAEYYIGIEAFAAVELVAALPQVAAEPIALLKQSKGRGKNRHFTGVCTASINAVNELLDFGSHWNIHWVHCNFLAFESICGDAVLVWQLLKTE